MPPAAVAELERRARRNRLEPESRASATQASRGPSRDRPRASARAHPQGQCDRHQRRRKPAFRRSSGGFWNCVRSAATRPRCWPVRAFSRRQTFKPPWTTTGSATAGDALEATAPFGRRRARAGGPVNPARSRLGYRRCVRQRHRQQSAPTVDLLTPAGEVRRYEPLVSSIVIVGRSSDPPAAIEALARRRAPCFTGAAGGRS